MSGSMLMTGGVQESLPFEESKKTKPPSMWERIGHLPNEWQAFHEAVVESQANRVRRKTNTKLTPSYLSEHPEFDHTGPPPPDERCSCGSELTRNGNSVGFVRRSGKWRCRVCDVGTCSWPDCEGKAEYNRVDGNGKECRKHHCGWCSAPGCDSWADASIKDGAYVCRPCSKGKCPCGRAGFVLVDGVYLCPSCAGYKCEEDGCGSTSNGRDADGRLLCKRHLYGTCEIHGCEAPANASHGKCKEHRAYGDDWVARETVREGPGFDYFFDIHHVSNGRLVGVGHGHIHHSTARPTFRKYDNNLAAEGLRRGRTLLLEVPDVSMAKHDDKLIRQTIPGRTLEQKTGKKVDRLSRESNCDVSFLEMLRLADTNEHINLRLFAGFNDGPEEWACKWFMLDDDHNVIPHRVPDHRIVNVTIVDTFGE